MAILIEHEIKTLGQLRPILRGFRKSAGLTQAILASRLGVTQQTYAQFEANPASASVERLFKVLRALDIELTLTLTQVYAAPAGKDKGEVAKTAAGARARAGARRAVPPASAPAPSAAGRPPRPARKRAAPKKREDW
ncbi:putative transcriptional regulator HipB [Burkholderia pseudomallei]|uniref:helix-turn-helix domain-containing protein n=1 Tax=Burkholderia pseudomallei TaxID=28450 RepID=UPI000717E23D|nr:helix-turn-helix domain-containing protein [Burkholderia pseudomallei]NAX13655.1 helix-turn-helix domain-containing protein [Burkholderia pseudomallei]NAY00114.1 helix-turn-helix domain-containing protein [Burkholderia pseudomallei]NAY19983.1 helix-turn-helix domain-containing protein [Burkholderia pseudomallei]NAY25470.1 helix-turn-helix domain-containing protein [Burkholderia pseudomallei]NAY31960.1 helix-turn-helix domain-containing protein [Burkholderia pseudomallei]